MEALEGLLAERSIGHGRRVALRNGRLIDVARGRYHDPGSTLLIQGERIVALLDAGAKVAADVEIDLGGRAVLPGLFNTHSHVQMELPTPLPRLRDLRIIRKHRDAQTELAMGDCLARGVTHLRDALTPDMARFRALSERISRGELPGPRVHPSVLVAPVGGVFTRQRSRIERWLESSMGATAPDPGASTSGIVAFPAGAGAAEVRAAVDRAIDERGARYLKFYDQRELLAPVRRVAVVMTDVQLEAAADQARRRGVPTTMHHSTVEGFRRGVRAGVTSLAHLPLDGILLASEVRACAASGCIIEPTLTVGYGVGWPAAGHAGQVEDWWTGEWLPRFEVYRAATFDAAMEASWLPDLQPMAKATRERVAHDRTKAVGLMQMGAQFRTWAHLLVEGVINLRRMLAAGVTLACGTDAGAVSVGEGMIGLELALLRLCLNEEGEPLRWGAADALRAATLHAARSLGLESEAGSLEPGKVADLVVLEGDPLADPDLIGSLATAVAKAGVWS